MGTMGVGVGGVEKNPRGHLECQKRCLHSTGNSLALLRVHLKMENSCQNYSGPVSGHPIVLALHTRGQQRFVLRTCNQFLGMCKRTCVPTGKTQRPSDTLNLIQILLLLLIIVTITYIYNALNDALSAYRIHNTL